MRTGVYARVASKARADRGAMEFQLEALRAKVAAEGDEVVAEFVDDGYSGLCLDRPGLHALRKAAEAGTIEAVWSLSPDRLARVYHDQQMILDELTHREVLVRFIDGPPLMAILGEKWAQLAAAAGPFDAVSATTPLTSLSDGGPHGHQQSLTTQLQRSTAARHETTTTASKP